MSTVENVAYQSDYLMVDRQQGIFRVNRRAYNDQAVFEEEKRKVLYKCWTMLGHESEIRNKGDFVTRQVLDRNLIFNRDADGDVNVFYNSCAHRGAAVCPAKSGNQKGYSCPYHGWRYSNKGQLLSTGSVESDQDYPENYTQGGMGLTRVERVGKVAGFYFICFDANAEPLETYLGGAIDWLQRILDQSAEGMEVVAGLHEYDINANYKLLCENSYDAYHLQPTHVSYFNYVAQVLKGTDMDAGITGEINTVGNGHGYFQSPIKAGRPIAQWLPTWGEELKGLIEEKRREVIARVGEQRGALVCDTHSNMVIFPNTIINDQQTILIRTVIPLSHNRMRVRAWSIAPVDEHPAVKEVRLSNLLSFLGPSGFATPDDVTMLESCQAAYDATPVEWSDFSKGFHTEENTMESRGNPFQNETHMRAFWSTWEQMMLAEE